MNIRFIRVYALAFLSFAMALQASAKICTVNVEKVFGSYKKAQDALALLKSSEENAENEIRAMIDERDKVYRQGVEILEKINNPALTEQARQDLNNQLQEKSRAIQEMDMKINEFRNQAEQTLRQRHQSIINLHLSEIREVVVEVAKVKGAEVVLNTNGIFVVYSDPALDITDDVIAKLSK